MFFSAMVGVGIPGGIWLPRRWRRVVMGLCAVGLLIGLALISGLLFGEMLWRQTVWHPIMLGLAGAGLAITGGGLLMGMWFGIGLDRWKKGSRPESRWREVATVLGAIGLVGVMEGLSLLWLVMLIFMPTNEWENRSPASQAEMAAITREWGRLAPFPKTARDFTIRTEGNMFTRGFRGSFRDTPENVRAWLDASPGAMEGTRKEGRIFLEMGDGAQYGEVEVSPDGTEVKFRVSWS